MTKPHFLYVDESGAFETGVRSAIGGIWAPVAVTQNEARAWWNDVLEKPLDGTFHANEYRGDLDELVHRATCAWQSRGWRPFLVEHSSQQAVVDNATTYVHVFAEGITKFARQVVAEAKAGVDVKILAASRYLPRDGAREVLDRMPAELYTSRLRERVGLEMIRAPRRTGEHPWSWTLEFASARQDPRLMMADLVCYAWYRSHRLAPRAQLAFDSFLADWRFEALRADDADRIRLHLERGELGLALLDVLALSSDKHPPAWLARIRERVVAEVAALEPGERDAALQVPLGRIHTELELRRDLDQADRLQAAWTECLLTPLAAACPAPEATRLQWAEAQSLVLRLAACNHRGLVVEADRAVVALSAMRGRLAARFERLPLALEARILEAVHWCNVYDFERACQEMVALASTFGDLLGLMVELEQATTEIGALRSDILGKALGTATQAAFMAARRDGTRYDDARRLSDRALTEFEREDDQRRQAGYRAQLETDAGDLEAALGYLTRACGRLDGGVPLIAEAARANPFLAMHLVRYWEAAARRGDRVRADTVAAAWTTSGLDQDARWDAPTIHPAQVIVWKWGTALGYQGDFIGARRLLDRAAKACEADPAQLTIRTIGAAIQCDRLAVLLQAADRNASRNAFESLNRTLEAFLSDRNPSSLAAYFRNWPARVAAAYEAADAKAFRELAWDVPY